MTGCEDRSPLIDASVFITLAAIDAVDQLHGIPGTVAIPEAVADEIIDEPAATELATAERDDQIEQISPSSSEAVETAARHLGVAGRDEYEGGDVPLLSCALESSEAVVITDDKPLRKACKALGIPVSGSIGVLIAAVERGELDPEQAKELLVAMDEVGARLSARLLRRAERLIDEAT